MLRTLLEGFVRFVVLDDEGVPIRWGRERRLFTGAARDAGWALSPRCTHPGCRVRAGRCQIDHLTEWHQGGETCPDNGGVGCGRHNRMKHRRGYTVTRRSPRHVAHPSPRWHRDRLTLAVHGLSPVREMAGLGFRGRFSGHRCDVRCSVRCGDVGTPRWRDRIVRPDRPRMLGSSDSETSAASSPARCYAMASISRCATWHRPRPCVPRRWRALGRFATARWRSPSTSWSPACRRRPR